MIEIINNLHLNSDEYSIRDSHRRLKSGEDVVPNDASNVLEIAIGD